jgi:hypothetical protein
MNSTQSIVLYVILIGIMLYFMKPYILMWWRWQKFGPWRTGLFTLKMRFNESGDKIYTLDVNCNWVRTCQLPPPNQVSINKLIVQIKTRNIQTLRLIFLQRYAPEIDRHRTSSEYLSKLCFEALTYSSTNNAAKFVTISATECLL